MKKLLSLVLIIAGLALGFLVLPNYINIAIGSTADKLAVGDEGTLTTQVSDIAELATIEYNYKDAVTLQDREVVAEGHKIPFTEKNIVMIYEGTLKVGVDTSKISMIVNKENDEVSEVIVTLPAVEILSNEVNRDTIEFPVEKSPVFNKLTKEDYDQIEIKADEKVRERIANNGTLERAEEETRTAVTNYIVAVYGKDVKVTFR